MGSSSSKFKKYIQHGDEFAALQIYQSCPELRKSLDPNLSYGESHQHNTALHYAARHAMKHLLRIFVTELGGDPNKRNSRNETGMHCCCDLASAHRTYSAQERRASCVSLLLQWRGPQPTDRIDIDAQDFRGNTALHVAASNGLHRCVQLLLAHGASAFVENNDKLTPCDLAVQAEHHLIARTLESTVVFGDGGGSTVIDVDVQSLEEVYSGLRAQDLQAAKDQLLVDTSDMFNVPLFTAETLLRDNEWSREALLERWMWDAAECCRSAGVPPPPWTSPSLPQTQLHSPEQINCEICLGDVPKSDTLGMACRHKFCTCCWSAYLTLRIQTGDAVGTPCPAYGCSLLVPHDIIEALVSPDVASKYLQFDIKEFVERNRCIKWCPKAGCGRAVRLPEAEHFEPQTDTATSHAVDCGNGHYFCWECLGEAHAPASCSDWRRWLARVAQIRPEELDIADSWSRSEDAANSLWLVSNSKPCPNCSSPIQKNEGCNHMKCSKCKFDFCWVCLEAWKRHGSATGGYFRCNRYEAVTKADEKQGILISEALVRSQESCELAKFLHFYTRFKNHENSRSMEEPLLSMAKHKMRVLASSLTHSDKDVKSTKFIEDSIRELLKARKILCGSYVYGYYLEDNGQSRSIFEFMQNELEEVVERLSEMVGRPYLRTRRSVIVETARLTRRKRHEFSRAVTRGFLPPDTPPTPQHSKQKNGKPSSVYSWPDLDLDTEKQKKGKPSSVYSWPDLDLDTECEGTCGREGCSYPKDRTASSDYCSVKCSQLDKVYRMNVRRDENTELAIALEMSRLQMIEDQLKMSQKQEENRPANRIGTSSVSVQIEAKEECVGGGGGPSDEHMPVPSESSSDASASREEHISTGVECSAQVERNGSPCQLPVGYEETSVVDSFLKSLGKVDLKSMSRVVPSTSWGRTHGHTFRRRGEDGRFQIGDLHETCMFTRHGEYLRPRHGKSLSTGDLTVTSRFELDSIRWRQHKSEVRVKVGGQNECLSSRSAFRSNGTPPRTLGTPTRCSGTPSRSSGATPKSSSTPPKSSSTPPRSSATTPRPVPTTPSTTSIPSKTDRGKEEYGICVEASCIESITRTDIVSWDKIISKPSPIKVSDKDSAGKKKERTSGKQLTIRIYNTSSSSHSQPLETDSSYESETGIPRSPTLYISGVSISRSPELGRSPVVRESRSASLGLVRPDIDPCCPRQSSSFPCLGHDSDLHVFRFPKSSTDGALSSVLHVQENNLSSDDFHEVLFLLDPSPRGSRRRHRPRKDRPTNQELTSQL